MLRGCEVVANIATPAVLDRLIEVGLTLNGNKCEFRLSKLTFFGYELTSDCINPSEEKIAAIQDESPQGC